MSTYTNINTTDERYPTGYEEARYPKPGSLTVVYISDTGRLNRAQIDLLLLF